ncbi:hypothetical protein PBRA_007255 [Plasmodiophora brassicae]|uniref:CDK5RAP1-like protein n=1 Tax=Plasmodiophora brassicae TaxID=37360 RepID=A0A0G4IW98_PLABS|nr:hypothetical protein PBRA_007255 [Plasmodiophora brassicae]
MMLSAWRTRVRRCTSLAAKRAKMVPDDGKTVADFIRPRAAGSGPVPDVAMSPTLTFNADRDPIAVPETRSFFIETYGCQMNVSDSEIVEAVLINSGFKRADSVTAADVVLINTCSIRDNAEEKVWSRLYELRALRGRRRGTAVAVLGCMAERLKERLLERDQLVNVVVGPDAYRDLPRLLSVARDGTSAVNVLLSLDETYADIAPVRPASNRVSAFVSIMRGCNNLCSYCIVPYTRGRERSRNADSIISEIQDLSREGFKEVTLLGQNVNSYNDVTGADRGTFTIKDFNLSNPGFSQKTKRASRMGIRFPELLRRCAEVDPEIRIRFTSPHPKDFPLELLQVVAEYPNVCKALHIPAQSGSTSVLERMKRDYSREAYDDLIATVRDKIPGCSLTSDFISGFCGETEEDHHMTLDLIRKTGYTHAFMFAYSQREKTHAHQYLLDDVPDDVKSRRLREVTETHHDLARSNAMRNVGSTQVVLVEGDSKRSSEFLAGRSDSNVKVVFPKIELHGDCDVSKSVPRPGEYVVVNIDSATQRSMVGTPVRRTSLQAVGNV